MAATIGSDSVTKRYAVVTGANKGIGFGICKHLASNGITVVLTARNEKRGTEAVDKLVKEFGVSFDHIIFHKLDVSDSSSVLTLAEFVKTQFGRLDILVNNAGMGGATADEEALKATAGEGGPQDNWGSIVTETYELAVECLQTNYYGSKRMVEAFIPLLQLSHSPRIVNVSSFTGKLKNIPNEWAKQVLSTDAETLTEDKIDSVVNEFLKDFKEGTHKEKGWPASVPAYIVSKASLNAYTRVMAKCYPTFKINSVCPGFVKTDINYNSGVLSVDEGAESIVRLCLLPNDGPSGLYFDRNEASSYIE